MDDLVKTLLLYMVLINVLAFVLMAKDKRSAKGGQRRIRERTLLTVALFGGAPGVFAAMRARRHKTKHAIFKYGVPPLAVAQVLLLVYVWSSRFW